MAKKPKRPADVIGNAVKVMRIAVGEDSDNEPLNDGKNKAARELGILGGKARARKLMAEERRAIAKRAAKKRWS